MEHVHEHKEFGWRDRTHSHELGEIAHQHLGLEWRGYLPAARTRPDPVRELTGLLEEKLLTTMEALGMIGAFTLIGLLVAWIVAVLVLA